MVRENLTKFREGLQTGTTWHGISLTLTGVSFLCFVLFLKLLR